MATQNREINDDNDGGSGHNAKSEREWVWTLFSSWILLKWLMQMNRTWQTKCQLRQNEVWTKNKFWLLSFVVVVIFVICFFFCLCSVVGYKQPKTMKYFFAIECAHLIGYHSLSSRLKWLSFFPCSSLSLALVIFCPHQFHQFDLIDKHFISIFHIRTWFFCCCIDFDCLLTWNSPTHTDMDINTSWRYEQMNKKKKEKMKNRA